MKTNRCTLCHMFTPVCAATRETHTCCCCSAWSACCGVLNALRFDRTTPCRIWRQLLRLCVECGVESSGVCMHAWCVVVHGMLCPCLFTSILFKTIRISTHQHARTHFIIDQTTHACVSRACSALRFLGSWWRGGVVAWWRGGVCVVRTVNLRA